MNRIVEMKKQQYPQEDGTSLQVLFIACNMDGSGVDGAGEVGEFVNEVASQFRAEIMLDPVTTMLLVTIVSALNADQFAELWRERCRADVLLRLNMGRLSKADVIEGSQDGRTLSQASLLINF